MHSWCSASVRFCCKTGRQVQVFEVTQRVLGPTPVLFSWTQCSRVQAHSKVPENQVGEPAFSGAAPSLSKFLRYKAPRGLVVPTPPPLKASSCAEFSCPRWRWMGPDACSAAPGPVVPSCPEQGQASQKEPQAKKQRATVPGGKCGWTEGCWGVRSFRENLNCTCCGVQTQEGRESPGRCVWACVWTGVGDQEGRGACLPEVTPECGKASQSRTLLVRGPDACGALWEPRHQTS